MIRPLLCFLAASVFVHAASYVPGTAQPPAIPREFRGAWVATVKNIDWPSKPGLSTAEQQAELKAILDRAKVLNLNAVILQVRPACDALYASKLEPWSEYLSGVQGKAPAPYWDPLQFAVAEAHARGLELHAWFNPFRARHNSGFSPLSRDHVSNTKPALVKKYGAHLWMDPGLPEVHDHSMQVILDVVKRYDIDGVHIDDYFYPYREKDGTGKEIPFPDWTSWSNYQKSGGKLERDDWRRDNVNRFVARMYREIKAVKPFLRIGISPFGIYRPGNPPQIRGFDQYASIYADPKTWLANGWLDYIAPQLYWRIEPPAQSFPVLLEWWTQNNPKNRLIIPGMATTSVGATENYTTDAGSKQWPAAEVVKQVELTRKQSGIAGHIHWNMSALMKNRGGVATELSRSVYGSPALPPALPSSTTAAMPKPRVTARSNGDGIKVEWTTAPKTDANFWLAQVKHGNAWSSHVLAGNTTWIKLQGTPSAIAVRAIGNFGELGPASTVEVERRAAAAK